MEKEKEELDLFDLFKECIQLCKKYLFNPFVFCVKFGLRNWWKLIIFTILGASLSVIIPKVLFSKYKGSMIISNKAGISSDYMNRIDLLSKQSPTAIARTLGISEQIAASIIKIKPHYIYRTDTLDTGYYVDYDDVNLRKGVESIKKGVPMRTDCFALELLAVDTVVFPIFEKAIINYLLTDKYFTNLNNMRLSAVQQKIPMLEAELSKLDSLRNIEYFENSRNDKYVNAPSGAIIADQTRLMHGDILNLENQLNSANFEIRFNNGPIKVVSSMFLEQFPENYWLFRIKYYAVLGFVSGFLFLLLFTYRKDINKFINS